MVPETQRYYNNDFGVYLFRTEENIPHSEPVQADPFDKQPAQATEWQSVLAGSMQRLTLGQPYDVTAQPVFNKKYGTWQYKPSVILAVRPSGAEEQKAFVHALLSPALADEVLAAYPNIVNDILEGTDNVDTSRIHGMGPYTYNRFKEQVLENYVISDILTLLQPLGVTYNVIQKLLSSEPNPSLLKAQLLDNPYLMTRVRGLGFKKVDSLALKLQPDIISSEKRAWAFIKWFLNEVAESDGNTWVTLSELGQGAKNNIPECEEAFRRVLQAEKEHPVLLHFDAGRVGLRSLWELEMNTLSILRELDKYPPCFTPEPEPAIQQSEQELGFSFTPEQKSAVQEVLSHQVSFLCGKAGVGKSTILNAVVKAFHGHSVACCALSAKAAQRIAEAAHHPASTIHRLLKWNGHEFEFSPQNPLPHDAVILDEASMVNIHLFYQLVSAIKPGGRVLICGDNRQLPPIGAGNVFNDMLYKNEFCVKVLTKVMRQAAMSGILSDANLIRDGKNPLAKPALKITTGQLQDMTYMFRDSAQALQSIAIKAYLGAVERDGLNHVILIVPRKTNCDNSTGALNAKLQDILIPPGTADEIEYGANVFRNGAKVIQRENNYDKNVFNGEVGEITSIYAETNEDGKSEWYVCVEYKSSEEPKPITYRKSELGQIELAYALTVHLAQGSGYHTVIAVIDTSHYILLDNCLLYTALTRAKKRCLLLAQPKAFLACIRKNKSTSRQTWLSLAQ